jgi:hypothetical protein
VRSDFVLPLFANGSPTIIFQSSKAYAHNRATNNLMLYGQVIYSKELTIKMGTGKRLFEKEINCSLELLGTEQLEKGVIVARYKPLS